MKTEQEIIKMIVHDEMLLRGYQDKVSQSKKGENIDYLLDEIEKIKFELNTLYSLFK